MLILWYITNDVMKYIFIVLVFYSQLGGTITKNNGEQIALSKIEIFQKQNVATNTTITYNYRGSQTSMDISKLKRINLKESLARKKGVTTWLALLVTDKNEKYEVKIDLVQVKGINSDGKEEVYSSNVINKITL